VGATPVFVALESPFENDIEEVRKRIPSNAKMAYVVNPNNPTGVLYSPEEIESLLISFPNTLFFIDEAYIEFGGVSSIPLVLKYQNIIVGRSTSKSFGLASFRLGYLVSAPENLVHINKIRNGKNVTAVAQVATLAALEDTSYIQKYVVEVQESREDMISGLRSLGFTARTTPANFILVPVANPVVFCETLATEKVFVRSLAHLAGMEGYVRITVGRKENTKRFLEIVRELISHGRIHST
jgi:histidinol-phosphate aminotransferase